MTGIVIIDKPAGWTSMDVCAKVRGALREKRVGHGGTLDPMATGVLPVFVGRATRAVPFLENADKRYTAGVRFGLETDTQDVTGSVLRQREATVTERELRDALPAFLGRQKQTPPMYSAVKVGGRKLYELARRGESVERAPREIEIKNIALLGERDGDWYLDVRCSKGTYIRTLCADLGARLGCGAAMAALRRTEAGAYREQDAVPLADFLAAAAAGEAGRYLRPVESVFAAYPDARVGAAEEKLCRVGSPFPTALPDGLYRVFGESGFLMLGRAENGRMKTVKNFFEV